ncbi:hypothetical protein IPV69_08415 [Humisphaera borealis]|uniref:Dienelactone hydrolase domain-containing protein n=2 Tax=Humisphaera borealis TaxID=2807512 RepID=A0A7M2X3X7_9BACT|nr:hypothetical protein IPV69_08415 [Humisphaera borealis]
MTYGLSVSLGSLALAIPLSAQPLPGTAPLDDPSDQAMAMVESIDAYLMKAIADAPADRAKQWVVDTSSVEAYAKSVAERRRQLAGIVGLSDARPVFDGPELIATTKSPALVVKSAAFEIQAVRWPAVSANGITTIWGEGLLLSPVGRKPIATVIAIPDADQTPEQIAGIAPGVAEGSQFARRLAESGCRVIVPALVDRDDTFSTPLSGQKTNQPHREYIYRPAFQMGRTVIGYEIQKVLAIVDWLSREELNPSVGVIGYGEGGLLALYAGAIDERIDTVGVSGYFGPRDGLWQEPIYRNLQGLLQTFGDAEIGSLICPRKLVIDKAQGPQIAGPPAVRDGRRGAAPGKLLPIDPVAVGHEIARMNKLTGDLPPFVHVVNPEDGQPVSEPVLKAFLRPFGVSVAPLDPAPPKPTGAAGDPRARQKRLVEQMTAHTQQIVRDAEKARAVFMQPVDLRSREVGKFLTSVEPFRQRFDREQMAILPPSKDAPRVRSKRLYDEPKFVGYSVRIDSGNGIFAQGILLLPKDLKPGEKRPVVVCQHGLDGRPENLADPKIDHRAYHQVGVKLAERGFVVYCPQNPYIGEEKFRVLSRKAGPLGLTLWSFIVFQHRMTTDWLAGQPFVDKDRIAFYGLSYGGKTAMRIPAVIPRYCLSICSGDFNEWTWKCTSLDFRSGYPGTHEYEIYEWNLGNTFGYAEMAALIAPRPFMVERGHRDGVAPDEWVAYEYAKVRRMYADLKIPDRTEIEFFDGPHEIHGVGTFAFLHKHLNWPEPGGAK